MDDSMSMEDIVEPTKEVSFKMNLDMTAEQVEANKEELESSIAKVVGARTEHVSVRVVSRRQLRRFLESLTEIEVIVQTDDESTVTEAVKSPEFAGELSKEIENT